jgi:hypothetical protein
VELVPAVGSLRLLGRLVRPEPLGDVGRALPPGSRPAVGLLGRISGMFGRTVGSPGPVPPGTPTPPLGAVPIPPVPLGTLPGAPPAVPAPVEAPPELPCARASELVAMSASVASIDFFMSAPAAVRDSTGQPMRRFRVASPELSASRIHAA